MLDLIVGGLALFFSLICALLMVGGAGVNASNVVEPDGGWLLYTGSGVILGVLVAIYFFYRFFRYREKDVFGTQTL